MTDEPKKLGQISAMPPPPVCWKARLEKVASINWGPTPLVENILPTVRPASGDSVKSCIDLPDMLICDGTYECSSPTGWIHQLMFLDLSFFKSRMFSLKVGMKTQSGRTSLRVNQLFDESVPIDKISILGATSSENLVARCKWGNYLVQGIVAASVQIETPVGTITGDADNLGFRCINSENSGFF